MVTGADPIVLQTGLPHPPDPPTSRPRARRADLLPPQDPLLPTDPDPAVPWVVEAEVITGAEAAVTTEAAEAAVLAEAGAEAEDGKAMSRPFESPAKKNDCPEIFPSSR
jgi:hypothetical protein